MLVKILTLILILTFGPGARALTAAESQNLWQRSLRFYQQQDFEKSRNTLLLLVKADPKNALYWFNLGNSYFMLQQYNYAETCFYRVEVLRSPLAPAARLYRAKSLTARGEKEQAHRMLQGLAAAPTTPKAIREEAAKDLIALGESGGTASEVLKLYQAGKFRRAMRVLKEAEIQDDNLRLLKAMLLIKLNREDAAQEILAKLQNSGTEGVREMARHLYDRIRNTYSKPKWLFVETSGGYDSNVQGASTGESGSALATLFGAGGRFFNEGLWYATAGYAGRWREYPGHSEVSGLAHEVRANAGREVSTDLILLSPYYTHESWDGAARRSMTGATLRVRKGNEALEYGVEADVHADSALSGEQEYLEGSGQNYQLYAGLISFPFYVRGTLRWERNDSGDQTFSNGDVIPSAYRSYGFGFTLLLRLRKDWAAETSASYVTRYYPTLASPGNERREDDAYSLSLRATKIFTPKFSAYASLSYGKNSSTLDASSVSNENYSQTQALAGVIWDAL